MQATELIDAANREMAENIHRPIIIQSSIQQTVMVVGLVQLALRHPAIGADVHRNAKGWVDKVHSYLLNEGLPGLAALVDVGWEPATPESEGDHNER